MSGHHPFSNLTKDFTPERRQRIKAMTDELRADIDRREAARKDPDKTKQPQPRQKATT